MFEPRAKEGGKMKQMHPRFIGIVALAFLLTLHFGLVPQEAIGADRIPEKTPRKSVVGRLLDWSLRNAGIDPNATDAENAEKFGKDWLSPFGPQETIEEDMQKIVDQVLVGEEKIDSILQDHTLSDSEKVQHLRKIMGNVKTCPRCMRTYPVDYLFCPYDRARLKIIEIPAGMKPPLVSPGKRTFTNSTGMKFVYVPPGSFMMGSPKAVLDDDSDEIQHRVTLKEGFFMGVMEVTQGQWKAVMANNPSYFKNSGDDYPVEQVSWNEAQAFIRSLNRKEGVNKYRLPTEAEWEYACRAGTTTPFYTGNCISTDEVNYDGHYPMPGCPKGQDKNKTVRAGSYLPNSFGLYDMHGNVWEWCQDWYGFYPVSHVTDPKGRSSGKWHVFRGGSWNSSAWDSRSAARSCGKPLYRQYGLGFRVARDL